MAFGKAFSRRHFIFFGVAGLAACGAAGLAAFSFGTKSYAKRSCFKPEEPAVKLLKDGRQVQLLERYEFVAADGRAWPVPKETIVDGASIPQVFWSLIGGPFEGQYRGPSIVHDYYCVKRSRKSLEVHAMFHEGMLCAGVGSRRAFIMFEAVRRFGPSWADPQPRPPKCEVASDDYDFDLCTQNAAPPAAEVPSLGRGDLAKFLDDVRDQADPADIAKLKRELEKM